MASGSQPPASHLHPPLGSSLFSVHSSSVFYCFSPLPIFFLFFRRNPLASRDLSTFSYLTCSHHFSINCTTSTCNLRFDTSYIHILEEMPCKKKGFTRVLLGFKGNRQLKRKLDLSIGGLRVNPAETGSTTHPQRPARFLRLCAPDSRAQGWPSSREASLIILDWCRPG
jgi:hypothetical protein